MKNLKLAGLMVMMLSATGAHAFGNTDNSSGAAALAAQQQGQAQGQLQGQLQGQGQIGINSNSNRNSNLNRNSNDSGAFSASGAAAIQKGNDTNVTIEDNSVYEAYDRDNTPPVSAPGLVAGATTCLGSASGGLSLPGFGFSAGSTTIDEACQSINGSIRFAQLGLNDAAVQVMCNVPMYAETLAATGYDCSTPALNAMVVAPETSYTSTSSTGMFGF